MLNTLARIARFALGAVIGHHILLWVVTIMLYIVDNPNGKNKKRKKHKNAEEN